MCPNICNSYKKNNLAKNNKSKKFNFKILSFLSLLIFNLSFNLQAQTASSVAIAQRNSVVNQIHTDAIKSGAPFLKTLQTVPVSILIPVIINKPILSAYAPLATGVFLAAQSKIDQSFVPALAYLGSNGTLPSASNTPGLSNFISANPILAPLVSPAAVVSADSNYPDLSIDSATNSGLLNKTAGFCTALESLLGTTITWPSTSSQWLGATCVVGQDNQCCDNLVCVADSTLNLGSTPDGKAQYGVCDTPPCISSGAACTGAGAGNCCQTSTALVCNSKSVCNTCIPSGSATTCAGNADCCQSAEQPLICDTNNSCKTPVGQACTSGNKDCAAGAICEANGTSTIGTCKVPVGQPCSSVLGSAGCATGTSCGNVPAFGSNAALTNVCSIAVTDSCAGTGALYCQTGSICDIGASASTCVAAGQIPTDDSGCFANTDCISGLCTGASGAKPGVCKTPCATPASCTTATECCNGDICNSQGICAACIASGAQTQCKGDADCCTGANCDLTTSLCVTGIPVNDGCTNLGVVLGGCAAGLACQPTQASSGPANTCQKLTCPAPNASGCMVSGSSESLNGCLDGTNCCSCACSTNYTCQG
jgi:hypothetical protein